jgi:bidirectional [NiFe] hydrogenase diaphorase subunit
LNCESVQEKECSASEFHPSGDKRFKLLDAAMKKHQFQADALLEVLHRPR